MVRRVAGMRNRAVIYIFVILVLVGLVSGCGCNDSRKRGDQSRDKWRY